MNGPDHFREAERLREQAAEWMDADLGWKAQLSTEERLAYRANDLADATVHAILSVAAAIATNDRMEGMSVDQLAEWREEHEALSGQGLSDTEISRTLGVSSDQLAYALKASA